MTVHSAMADFLNVRELALTDEGEARAYSDVLKEYLRHHHPNLMLDEKRMSLINMLIFASGFYGTRLMAFRMRRSEEKERAPGKPRPVPTVPPQRVNGEARAPEAVQPGDLWGGIAPGVVEVPEG
jgi:hypothetical protein